VRCARTESHYDQRGRQIGKDFHAPVVIVIVIVIRTELAVAAVMVVNALYSSTASLVAAKEERLCTNAARP
jgi:hypothetical protein